MVETIQPAAPAPDTSLTPRRGRPDIAADATELIGNTPLVRLSRFAAGLPGVLVGKLEAFSPGFSVKDRIGVAMIDEAERSLHDALSVLSQTVKETRVVLGGGCSEMLMSCAVEEEARKIQGKKAIAAEAFARALRQMPTILADNAGFDSSDLVAKLRVAHYEGQADAGLSECIDNAAREWY